MIAPRSILIWLTAAVLVPAALVSAGDPSMVVLLLGAAVVVAAVAAGDAMAVGDRLAGIEIQLPAVTRLSKGIEGQITLQVLNRTDRPMHIRVAIAADHRIGCAEPSQWVDLPAQAGVTVEFACRPGVRGKYDLRQCCIGMASPLGLWLRRKILSCESEVRVHPDGDAAFSFDTVDSGGVGAHQIDEFSKAESTLVHVVQHQRHHGLHPR